MSKVQLDRLILLCEVSGCAVPPPHVVGLIDALRKYVGLTSEMAQLIYDRNVCSGAELDHLSDLMEAARTVTMP